MSFGEKLRAARESRGYTQQQVADHMKIDKSTYCGYETGKRQPDVQKIKQLSKFLGVSGDELLETGYVVSPTKEFDILDEIDVAFYGDYKELSEDDKETLRAMARVMKERQARKNQEK